MNIKDMARELISISRAWGCDAEILSDIIVDARAVLRLIDAQPHRLALIRIHAALATAKTTIWRIEHEYALANA